jgi:F420-dependent oxidoreductase-like protein
LEGTIVKLCCTLNYNAGDVLAAADELVTLESAGLDCIWVPEAYSFDAVSTMGYIAGRTERVEIGSAIVNVYSRTPTLLAMTFAGLDAVSGGRAICGIGASGPQVIEGFHGVPYEHPMQRIRETIEVCRATWRREVIEYHGQAIDIPLSPGRGTGLGKALKLINQPVRDTIPIWWAALKGKSVEAAAEMADGWIPIFFAPELAGRVWGKALAAGAKKRPADMMPLQLMAGGVVKITDSDDEVTKILDAGRPAAALYVGGMGARGKNFYNDIMTAYGWAKEAKLIQDFYLEGNKTAAAAAVPREYLAAASLVGSIGHIKERLAIYKDAGVTHLEMALFGPLDEKIATVETMRKLVDEI